MNKKYLAPIVGAALLVVFALGAFLYDSQKRSELNQAAQQNVRFLERDYAPTKGDSNAKVTIVEFFDPACETCRSFHPIVTKLLKDYPGKIRVVMRYAPLHTGSDYVVKALEATRLQGKYWEALEALYFAQPVWASHGRPDLNQIWPALQKAGIDIAKAQQDMKTAEIATRLQQDIADMQQMQVTKTPSFFVNGKPLIKFGVQKFNNLVAQAILDNYYAK
ncbi:MAG: thioredoxin domain-containing protein [Sedimenticola sp.]